MTLKRSAGIAALAGGLLLGGCGGSDVPILSGNTVDRWNELSRTLPDAPLVNVSYAYEYAGTAPIRLDASAKGEGWVFVQKQPDVPTNSAVVVTHVNKAPDSFDTVNEIGRTQLMVNRYCVTVSQRADIPTADDYLSAVERFGDPLGGDFYVQIYTEQQPDEAGRHLQIGYIEGLEQGCDTDEFRTTREAFFKRAERSFDIVG